MNSIPKKSTLLEKVFYCAGGVGGGSLCWAFISGFMTMYYTNSVGMAAAAVGTMMLTARVLDGVTDIIFGACMERFPNKRFGKTRHWLLLSVFLMPLCILLCFHMPSGLSAGGQVAYMYFSYILASAVGYTIYGGAFGALMARMSEDKKDIEHISAAYMLCVMGSATAVYMLTTIMLSRVDATMAAQSAWSKVAWIYAIITAICIFLSFLIKEKVPIQTEDGQLVEKTPLGKGVKACMKYKYFWLLALIFGFYYASSGLGSGSGSYYAGYVIGDWTYVSISSIPILIAELIAFFICPFITAKVDKVKVMKIGLLITTAAYFCRLINPTSIPLQLTMGIVAIVGQAPLISLLFTLSVDFIIFIACKTGMRAEGFAGIGGNVGVKVGTGVGSALVGWMLAWGKFDGTVLVQSDFTVRAIIIMCVVLPAIFSLLTFLSLCFWDLNKKLPQAMAEAEAASAQATED